MGIRLLLSLALSTALFAADHAPNELMSAEREAGWRLLFDGESSRNWEGMRGRPFPAQSWAIGDGTIRTREDGSGGDVCSVETFSDFELAFDWKISPDGNSGVKYLVQPEWLSPHWLPNDPEKRRDQFLRDAVGPEYQLFDDATLEGKPDAELSSTGALYLLYAPGNKRLNPPGEWNSSRIVVDGNHVEHWLNGGKLLEYELGSEELLGRVEQTKFRKVPGYGLKGAGRIVLQHHGEPAWFRNVKIRDLGASREATED